MLNPRRNDIASLLRRRLPNACLALAGALLFAPAVHAGILDATWNAPTTNADGTPLTDLLAYRVYFATSGTPCGGSTFQEVRSPTPSPAGSEGVSFRLSGLQAGTTYSAQVTAVDTSGNESTCSNLATAVARPDAADLVAAVLPSSRSVQVGSAATAFATMINAGQNTALGCGLSPITTLPATFSFQQTDPANQPSGTLNTPVDIPPGRAQSFIFSLTPTGSIAPVEVQLDFDCASTNPAPITVGLNTLLFSASATPGPDVVALAATLANDGIVNLPGATGTGVFAVATANVGAGAMITASPDTGGATLPVTLSICQTNPTTGACLASPASSVTTQIEANATPTFGIFVRGAGTIPFNPAANRIFVRFRDTGGATRGSTSVAVRTQ